MLLSVLTACNDPDIPKVDICFVDIDGLVCPDRRNNTTYKDPYPLARKKSYLAVTANDYEKIKSYVIDLYYDLQKCEAKLKD